MWFLFFLFVNVTGVFSSYFLSSDGFQLNLFVFFSLLEVEV
jgi:hypothetical protein